MVRRMLACFLFTVMIVLACPASAFDAVWPDRADGDAAYGSIRTFEWLAATGEMEQVMEASNVTPPIHDEIPMYAYFRGNGECEFVALDKKAKVIRGTWKIVDEKLQIQLISLDTYAEGTKEAFVPPVIESYEFTEWEKVVFRVSEPRKRMFEEAETDLKEEYLIGVWYDYPIQVENGLGTKVLRLEENGEYELFCESDEPVTTQERVQTRLGTWRIVENKLELIQTKQKQSWGGVIVTDLSGSQFVRNQKLRTVELDSPIVDTYEIAGLQYVFDVPKEYNDGDVATNMTAYVMNNGLMNLGRQLTVRIGETWFWN